MIDMKHFDETQLLVFHHRVIVPCSNHKRQTLEKKEVYQFPLVVNILWKLLIHYRYFFKYQSPEICKGTH